MLIKNIYARFKNSISTNNSKIVFLHVPKCGGTSIDTAIVEKYLTLRDRKDECYRRVDSLRTAYAGAKLYGFDFFRGEVQNNRNMLFNRDLAFYYMLDPKIKYLSGHFPFDDKLFKEFSSEFGFVTLLRDPVEKWLSNFYYRKRRQCRKKQKNDRLQGHWSVEETIEEYIESERGKFHGYDYPKYFGGVRDDYRYSSEKAISKAKENLENFAIVGFLDNTSGFAENLERKFGIKINVKYKNQSRTETFSSLSLGTQNKIKEVCSADIEIYQYAKRKFESN